MDWPHQLTFDRAQPEETLAQLPSTQAVYALYGRDANAEPYVGRTPDLRRRLRRLLTPSAAHPRRLHLAGLVARIAYVQISCDLEGTLLLYQVSQEAFGARAAKRMHLRTPGFLRMSMGNDYPRLYVTNSVTHKAAADLFGPFASRAAADRYAEQVLDLFLLRHCYQDLEPDPAFPGCIYSEMKKCLAPCYQGCTDARYAEEAAAVHSFLSTGGKSLLTQVAAERDRASDALDFESAAAAHARYSRIETVAALASEAARSLASQHVVVVQPYHRRDEGENVALYLLKHGTWSGPVLYSTAGMRHPNEQSGSSSLFAHPVAFAAVPLAEDTRPPILLKGDVLEERLTHALTSLEQMQRPGSRQQLCEHLAIFARWYYRPAAKREGEAIFFNSEDTHATPAPKLVLRAVSRVWRASQTGRIAAESASVTALS
jgi:hypothetical protein